MIDKSNNILTAVDLFSGAGGFSLGAYNIGINVLAAVEIDRDACETYRNNIIKKRSPETKLFERDILLFDPVEFKQELKLQLGELDCLIGGPPCQGFSSHRLKNKGVNDPRNQLLLRYFDFVKELKPKFFLVENVPGLLWPRHEPYLQRFKNLSLSNGYKIFGPTRLNAKHFGIPQNRIRIFVLGIRSDQNPVNTVWPPRADHFAPGKGKPEWVPAASVFSKPPKEVLNYLEKIVGLSKAGNLPFNSGIIDQRKDLSAVRMNHAAHMIKRFSDTPINGSRSDNPYSLECHANGHDGHKDVYGRIRLGQPGPTITTGCFNPSKGRFLHPWEDNGITIRHAARFQTFPDDFIFSAGITSQAKQVGNAVPVQLAEVVLKTALRVAGFN
jgi:DNA (cytosine-5)-methyltransferase 1